MRFFSLSDGINVYFNEMIENIEIPLIIYKKVFSSYVMLVKYSLRKNMF